jgi:hypothetical protein
MRLAYDFHVRAHVDSTYPHCDAAYTILTGHGVEAPQEHDRILADSLLSIVRTQVAEYITNYTQTDEAYKKKPVPLRITWILEKIYEVAASVFNAQMEQVKSMRASAMHN